MKMLDMMLRMKHHPIYNYAGIPGLTSWLVGDPGPNSKAYGCMRLLINERAHHENIIPHSHRFDLHCTVLKGGVTNFIWNIAAGNSIAESDTFTRTPLEYNGKAGKYELQRHKSAISTPYYVDRNDYGPGDEYFMKSSDIHSIFFGRDTVVLMIEGPTNARHSYILEPCVNGKTVETFNVPDYAFADKWE